jgi:phage tail-like protein
MSAPRPAILLDPRNGWQTGSAVNVGTLGPAGLHLISSGGTAGAFAAVPEWLAAPAWAAAADLTAYLLGPDGWVRRYEPVTGGFAEVFNAADYGLEASGVAVSGEDVYVLDADRGVILVMSRLGYPRQILRPPGTPSAVCGLPHGAAVLAARDGATTVHWHRTGSLTIEPGGLGLGEGTWTRIAAGSDDLVYALDAATSVAAAINPDPYPGQLVTTTTDGPSVLATIRPPGLDVDPAGGLLLPGLTGRVNRSGRPACETPATILTRPVTYRQGSWISTRLDSHVYRCQWHRIRLQAQLLPATSVRVSTYSQDVPPDDDAAPPVIADADWRTMGTVRPGDNDLLILGSPGRYLWVRLDLAGDGYSTPSVASLRLEYPRNSYLRFLPAVYSADPGSAEFLARYLAIAQTSVEDIEAGLADLPGLFDPLAVPDRFVDYLAGWLDVPVEGTWDSKQKRLLIDATRGYFRRRGTPAAIRAHVAAYLHSMSGVAPADDGLPQLVEGFRQRRYRTLPSAADSQHPLWSLAVTARLQADQFDRLGQVRLVSAGDPALDMFTEHAYRFSVFVPAALASKPADRQMLRRAIDTESPAHTKGELVLVRPAMCLGRQSHLGLDSMLAAPAPLRLTCAQSIAAAQAGGEEVTEGRLDGLSVLGTSRTYRGWRLGQHGPGSSLLPVS